MSKEIDWGNLHKNALKVTATSENIKDSIKLLDSIEELKNKTLQERITLSQLNAWEIIKGLSLLMVLGLSFPIILYLIVRIIQILQ